MRVLLYCRGEENPGVGYLLSALKRSGHDARLLFDPGLSDVFFGGRRLFGQLFPDERLVEQARRFAPDVVGYSTLTLSYYAVRRIAARIKAATGAVQIAGGPHATAAPDAVLEDPSFDYALVGEADRALPLLVEALAGGDPAASPNVVSRDGASVRRSALLPLVDNLDGLPSPDKRAFLAVGAAGKRLGILTARGCPFACTYCSHSDRHEAYRGLGRYYRQRSVDGVLAEIVASRPLGFTSVRIWDDLFGFRREWTDEFLDRYRREIGLPFSATMHAVSIDERMARALKDAGCTRVALGVQSGDEEVRTSVLARKETVERSREAIAALRRAGVFVLAEVMFGLPGETPEQMDATARFCMDARPGNVSAFIYFPMPGTALVRSAVRDGHLARETLRAVERGETSTASWHKRSLLDSPHTGTAYRLKILLPIAARFPRLGKWLLGIRSDRAIRALFLVSIPLVDQHEFVQKLRDYGNMIRARLRRGPLVAEDR